MRNLLYISIEVNIKHGRRSGQVPLCHDCMTYYSQKMQTLLFILNFSRFFDNSETRSLCDPQHMDETTPGFLPNTGGNDARRGNKMSCNQPEPT